MQRIPHCFRKRTLSADLYRFKPRKKLVQQRLDLYQTLFVSFICGHINQQTFLMIYSVKVSDRFRCNR